MSRLLLTSDQHLGHKSICRFRTQFSSVEEHDDFVISNYCSIVKKHDTVYFLGDVAFTQQAIQRIKELPGHKVLILGNHDTELPTHLLQKLLGCFNKVHGITTKHHCWISHAPIHPTELRSKPNIHGHTHNTIIKDHRYANICLENTNYKPVLFTDIQQAFKQNQIFTGY